MTELFLRVLQMSLMAAGVVLIALPLRWLFRRLRLPALACELLWLVVAVRMLLPVGLVTGPFSVLGWLTPAVQEQTEALARTEEIVLLPAAPDPALPAEPAPSFAIPEAVPAPEEAAPAAEGLSVLDVLASARRRRISALTTGFASGAGETRRRFAEMLSLRKKQRGTPLLCLLLALVVLASTLVACAAPARSDTAAPVYKGGTPQPTAGEAPEERLERLREELQTLQAEIGRLEALAAQDSSLEEIQRQYLQAQQEWAEWSAAVPEGAPSGGAAQFAWPLPGSTTLSSDFGTARRVYGAKDVHTGMDIPAPAGTPVYAAADGAASLNNHWVMGISVKLDHGGSLATLYGHLSACAVKDGDLVEKGQLIGYVGSTGNSTGNHLHFEVDLNGDPVSAWPYLNAE